MTGKLACISLCHSDESILFILICWVLHPPWYCHVNLGRVRLVQCGWAALLYVSLQLRGKVVINVKTFRGNLAMKRIKRETHKLWCLTYCIWRRPDGRSFFLFFFFHTLCLWSMLKSFKSLWAKSIFHKGNADHLSCPPSLIHSKPFVTHTLALKGVRRSLERNSLLRAQSTETDLWLYLY